MNEETVIMYGKEVADKMLSGLSFVAETRLVILSNQADPASKVYVNNKKKKCDEYNICCDVFDISNSEIDEVENILWDVANSVCDYPYVIIQKPLPEQLQKYEQRLDNFFVEYPYTDIDAFDGDLSTEFKTPATPLGIIKMLDYYVGLEKLDGMNAVVIGRSKIVGKPMAELLNKYNCTVTLCHSHTNEENLKYFTKNADLIISAVGKPKFLTKEYFGNNKRPIVVDVGINRDENGKLCGDVDFENVKDFCSFISPVPKGVGVLTVASLIYKIGENKNG